MAFQVSDLNVVLSLGSRQVFVVPQLTMARVLIVQAIVSI